MVGGCGDGGWGGGGGDGWGLMMVTGVWLRW